MPWGLQGKHADPRLRRVTACHTAVLKGTLRAFYLYTSRLKPV